MEPAADCEFLWPLLESVRFMSRLKKTILCIDDQWIGLIQRKMFLESQGYRVLEATTGDEGLELFRSHIVHAIVLDYQMPGMNGNVVAERMKRMKPSIPILLLSAYGPLPDNKLESVDAFLTNSQGDKIFLSTLQKLLVAGRNHFSRAGSIPGRGEMRR